MKKKFKTKQEAGITLIALIITIIVLLILAAVSISLVVGDNGVLGQAVNATVATDVAETKEAIELAVIGYLDSNGNYTIADVEQAVSDAGATLGSDGVTVTTAKGNTVDISDLVAGAKAASWYYVDNETVSNGDLTLAIGDVVYYDEQNQTRSGATSTYTSKAATTGMTTDNWGSDVDQEFTLSNNDVGWMVLGVDEDTGELLIVSDAIVYTDTVVDSGWNKNWYALYGREGYANAVSELNNICKMFGYGTGASGARVLDQDDVDKVLGFDYDTALSTLSSDYTGKGYVWENGAKVTVSWAGSSNYYPTYKTSSLISESLEGTLGGYHSSGFYWYDEDDGWQYSAVATGSAETIATIENKYSYWYYGKDLVDTDSAAYKTVFIVDQEFYFLGSAYSGVRSGYGYWGLCGVDTYGDGFTGGYYGLANSYGYVDFNGAGFRPVVSLSSDVTLEGSSSAGWTVK